MLKRVPQVFHLSPTSLYPTLPRTSLNAIPKLTFKRQMTHLAMTQQRALPCVSIPFQIQRYQKHESPHKNLAINNLQLKLP